MLLNARKAFGLSNGSLAHSSAPEKLTGLGATGNVCEELGVTTVINAQGTMTYLGGSLGPGHELYAESRPEKIIAAQLVQLFKSHWS